MKMIRATNQFQTIIDRYQKSLKRRKSKDSLNSLFVKDLKQVKGFNNFSDEEYMISEIKNENKIKNENILRNNKKYSNYSNNNLSHEKISKDIFFYYRNKINEKNNHINSNKNTNFNLRVNSASYRINSGKKSNISIASSYSRTTKRKKSSISLILPLIYPKNLIFNQYNKKNNKSYISDDEASANLLSWDKSETNLKTDINEGRNYDINNNKKPAKNSIINDNLNKKKFNVLSIREIIKNIRMRKCEKELLYKQYIPLYENDIFIKINNVNKKSNLIKKNINYLSSEGNLAYENEKNRIKFLNDIMGE